MSQSAPLPRRDKLALATALRDTIEREEQRTWFKRLMWRVAWLYLNGARQFKFYTGNQKPLDAWYLEDDGTLPFQSTELLAMLNRISGRLASTDLRPRVTRGTDSLESIRSRALGQVIADNIVREDMLEKLKTPFSHIFTALGCCGLRGFLDDDATIGLNLGLEVVHPTEVYPYPSQGYDYSKATGRIHRRMVPRWALDNTFGRRKVTQSITDADAWLVRPGEPTEVGDSAVFTDSYSSSTNRGYGSAVQQSEDDDDRSYVFELNEMWEWNDAGFVTRYVATSGDFVYADEMPYEDGKRVCCPLGWARFIETGDFYGAGGFDLLFPTHRRVERLMERLAQNVEDIDQYGFTVMPAGSWNKNVALREVGRGLRVLPYEPDVAAENFKPFHVQPHNSGEVPGKVALLFQQNLRDLSPIRDLANEKGRVDSAAGLQFLDEQMQQSITNPTRGLVQCFSDVWRAGVVGAVSSMVIEPRKMPVTRLDLALAGAVIDPATMTVGFSDNPLPKIHSLGFTVQQALPRSIAARKAEAVELHKLRFETTQMAPWEDFVLYAVREGLDFAIPTGEIQGAYESIVLDILVLFGDGEQPGEVVWTPYLSRPDIQLKILKEFMGSPTMRKASVDVQDAFILFQREMEQAISPVLPEGVPTPDDAAMLSSAMQPPNAAPQGQPQLAAR